MQEQRAGRHAHDAQHALERLREHLLNFRADETGRRQVHIGKRQHVLFDAALFLFVQPHHHQGRRKQLRQKLQRAQRIGDARAEQQLADQDRAPTEERSGQQQIRESFVAPAFLIEDPGDHREHRGDAELRRNSHRMQVVGGRPQCKHAARGNLRAHPRLGVRVHLRGAEKQQRCRGQQPFVDRRLPRSDGYPGLKSGAEVVQGEQAPSGAPEHQVGLAPQAVHVGEKARRQCRCRQQSDRNNAFRGHQIKCAAWAAVRTSHSMGMHWKSDG